MSATSPPWVTPDLAANISRRGLMPGVERLQTLFVRYHENGEARVGVWEQSQSRARGMGDGLDGHMFPAAINMRLVEAPAEFCVPVKQDRRLAPAFRVRVEVQMGTATSVPISVTAHLVTQKQKDNILIWSPDDDDDKQAKAYTELKGNTCLHCTFHAQPTMTGMLNSARGTLGPQGHHAANSHLAERLSLASALMNMGPRRPPYPPTPTSLASVISHSSHAPSDLLPPWAQQQQQQQSVAGAGSNTSLHMHQQPQQQHLHMGTGSSSDVTETPELASMRAAGLMMIGPQPPAAACSQPWADNLDNLMSSMSMGLPLNMKVEDLQGGGVLGSGAPHNDNSNTSLHTVGNMASQDPSRVRPMGMDPTTAAAMAHAHHNNLAALAAQQQQLQQSQGGLGGGGGGGARPVQAHELEFTGLEFLKPTRMNKVYMVFVCRVGPDMMTLVYHVPTIGICRAEQRIKALQKLGLPIELLPQSAELGVGASLSMGALQDPHSTMMETEHRLSNGSGLHGAGEGSSSPLPTISTKRRSSQMWAQEVEQRAAAMQSHQSHGSADVHSSAHKLSVSGTLPMVASGSELHPTTPPAGAFEPSQYHPPASHSGTLPVVDGGVRSPFSGMMPAPGVNLAPIAGVYHEGRLLMSRNDMRTNIIDEYASAGFTRKLTEQDVQALLSQAGLPPDEPAAVSLAQWTEFQDQWRGTMTLLRFISTLWNTTTPYIISGFDMDRRGTVQALANEPVGTFVIRFSLSQPGSLVLSCKVYPASGGHADQDNLVHGIITTRDLERKRVDAWVLGLSQATHVLDVYRQRRFNKTEVFGVQPLAAPARPTPANSGPGFYVPVSSLMQQQQQGEEVAQQQQQPARSAQSDPMGVDRFQFQSPFLNHEHIQQDIQLQLQQQLQQTLQQSPHQVSFS